MSASAFVERRIDPPDQFDGEWEDLLAEQRMDLLIIAMQEHPRLINCFYAEAQDEGVEPMDYLE